MAQKSIHDSQMANQTCNGCDEAGLDLSSYLVTHHDGSISPSLYCDDCAGLARADWNGETAAIAPVGAYMNRRCDRHCCSNSKPARTETLWCEECNALPSCGECGEPIIDCENGRGGYPCKDNGGLDDAALRREERRQMGISS